MSLLKNFLGIFLFTTSLMAPSTILSLPSPLDLSQSEKKVFSQNGEDGIFEKIFDVIGIKKGYYVEFGAEKGIESNTKYLRDYLGWRGLLMDGRYENPSINLHKEFVTAENINDLFAKYSVPYDLDLLSIDVDYNDFYIWKAIDSKYRPKVVVIEFNATHAPDQDKVIYYNPTGCWDWSNYFGASLLAFHRLARQKGYSLVYVEKQGVNSFFVRDDILSSLETSFLNINQVELLYQKPKYGSGPNGGHPQDPLNRPYLNSAGQPVK
jgi:hypothetical protein